MERGAGVCAHSLGGGLNAWGPCMCVNGRCQSGRGWRDRCRKALADWRTTWIAIRHTAPSIQSMCPEHVRRTLIAPPLAHATSAPSMQSALKATAALRPGTETTLDAETLEEIAGDAPSIELSREAVVAPLVDVLVAVGLQPSKAAARRYASSFSSLPPLHPIPSTSPHSSYLFPLIFPRVPSFPSCCCPPPLLHLPNPAEPKPAWSPVVCVGALQFCSVYGRRLPCGRVALSRCHLLCYVRATSSLADQRTR